MSQWRLVAGEHWRATAGLGVNWTRKKSRNIESDRQATTYVACSIRNTCGLPTALCGRLPEIRANRIIQSPGTRAKSEQCVGTPLGAQDHCRVVDEADFR